MHLGRKTAEEPICIGTMRPNEAFFAATYKPGTSGSVLGIELGEYFVEMAIRHSFMRGEGIPVWVSHAELEEMKIECPDGYVASIEPKHGAEILHQTSSDLQEQKSTVDRG